jgi:hypothetical protein
MPIMLATPDACAIFDGPDDDPFDDPQGNASRLYFHSSQPAPYRVQAYTGSFTRTWTSPKKITLQAHGLSYTPLVFGRVTLTAVSGSSASNPVFDGWASPVGTVFDLAGSVPVASFSETNRQFALWFNLSVDATNLYIIQINQRWAGVPGPTADPELTFSYAIEAMSVAVAGTAPSVTTANQLEITPTSMSMGRGKFDSSRRYIRRTSPSNYALASGRTIDVTGNVTTTSGASAIGMRYSFNGYIRQGYRATEQSRPAAPTSSFNATVRSVKI